MLFFLILLLALFVLIVRLVSVATLSEKLTHVKTILVFFKFGKIFEGFCLELVFDSVSCFCAHTIFSLFCDDLDVLFGLFRFKNLWYWFKLRFED